MRKKPENVEVYRNSENAKALIGVETPVDFDSYGIVVSATGYRAWRQTVNITEERKVVTMVIDLEQSLIVVLTATVAIVQPSPG